MRIRNVIAGAAGAPGWRPRLTPPRPSGDPRPRTATVGAALVPPTLLGLGVLHVAWALGSAWPATDRDSLAHWVLGDGAHMPPDAASWAVAALLSVAAGGVHAAARGAHSRHLPPLVWTTSLALIARGTLYPPVDIARGLAADSDRIDLAFVSPLCLLLGLGTLAVARDLPARRAR